MAAQNNIIGEVGLKVVPVDPAAQFQAGVDQIIRRLEKQAQFQVQASGLDKVQEQANQAGQAFANAALQAAGLTAAIFGIRASIEGTINKLSGLFDQLAQARAGFTSILNSQEAGGKLLDDIREFARVSPFVTQELVNYSQQLLGVGLAAKEIIPLLRSTGDIISSVGGDTQNLSRVLFTLTQIKSIGVLKGQDTMQLQNSLIPITKYLSEYLNKSAQEIVKLREAGLITADTVFNALNQQGEKVKGAMDAATRNISGARAVLSDTITQLFQDQPVLNQIFEDTYKSIQALANRIGEEDFQQAFAQFFDGVEKVYEGLKPLLADLAKIGESGALTGMTLLGSALNVVGESLQALEPLLPVLARFLAALIAIKAPLLLIQYANTFKTLASAVIPATRGLAGISAAQLKATQAATVYTSELVAQTVQLDANTAALTANQRALLGQTFAQQSAAAPQRAGFIRRNAAFGGAIAATIAGQALSQVDNGAAQTAGGALQGAGTGFLVAGPAGAVAGAAIGGTLAYLGRQEKELKKRIEEMKKLGEENAQAFIDANNEAFGAAASGNSFNAYRDEIKRVQEELIPLVEIQSVLREAGLGDARIPQLEGLQTQLEKIESSSAATFDPINAAIKDLVANLDESSAAYEAFTTPGRGIARTVVTDMNQAEEALRRYGFTLDDLNSPEKREQLAQYIPVFDGLTTSQQNATAAAIELNMALKTARETIAAIYDPVQTGISDQIAKLALSQSVVTAAFAAGANKNDQTKQLEFQLAASKAAEDAQARQLANDNILLKNLKERQALERAAGIEGLGASELADRQADEIAAFNDAAAIRQATAAKNEETRATLLLNAALQSSNRSRFALSEAQIKQQEKLLGLQDTQQNREIIANVRGAALQRIDQETQSLAANYEQRRKTAAEYGREIPTLQESADALKRRADVIAGIVVPATSAERKLLQDITAEIERQTKVVIDSIPPWQTFVDTFDKMKDSGDLLGSLFEVNDDNTTVLNATAENVGNVIRQLADQANSVFSEQLKNGVSALEAEEVAARSLWGQLELVQLTLGQTNDEFAITLSNAGLIQPTFDGISGSLASVAEQFGITEEHLARIVGLTGQIPADFNIVITADGQQAINELARVSQYYNDIIRDGERHALAGSEKVKELSDVIAKTGNIAFSGINKPLPSSGDGGAADKAASEAEALANRIKSATDALADKLEAAADSIAEAAKTWVTSIKERTQYEQAVSAGTAIRNTQRQIRDLTELAAGLTQLRAQGLSEEAIRSFGIDNVADVRQVRKLLRAQPGDINTLSQTVSQLNAQALTLATSEEDKRTQKNIAEGILAAADTLEIDFTKPEAAALAGTFNINSTSNADEIAAAIIAALSSGRTGR